MKLSKRGEYALRSMINLGIAAKVGRRIVRVTELAKAEDIPLKFLEQVMQQLREAGFLESERGKYGGYRLAKPMAKITIGQIVRLIDVRNAIAAILDRYTLSDVVEVITRKMLTSGYPLPFSIPLDASVTGRKTKAHRTKAATTSPTEGVIHQLLGDYAI